MSEPRTVPCAGCGQPRTRYGRMKGSLCRRCRAKKLGKTTWDYAQDTRAAKQERAARVWLEPTERPRCTGSIPLGTVLSHGSVQARGIKDGQRYYLLLDSHGAPRHFWASELESSTLSVTTLVESA